MKQRDLVKRLTDNGFTLKRHGGNHDVYQKFGKPSITVPRHTDIKENLATQILKDAGLE